jgi:hypothetical protein
VIIPKGVQEVFVMKWLSLVLFFTALISPTVYAKEWNVLVVDAAAEPGLEFQSLSDKIKEVRGEKVNYTQIVTANLKKETLKNYNAVWLGWNCTSDDGSYFRDPDADLIAAYVEAGGVLVTSASDNNGWKSDWLPAAVTVLDTGDYDLEITKEGKELFGNPNEVKPAEPIMDERYSAIDKKWTVLAWGVGMEGSEAGAIQIAPGKGLYLLVSIDTRNAGNTQINFPLMENMLNYAITYVKKGAVVEPRDKLTTVWGKIKISR